jgi:spermidine/putrescine transport system ATP-binding protein
MSDRIAVMSKGKVQQMGTPVEVYERPANKFVADFIGESNFLEGTIKSISKDEATVFVPSLNAKVTGMPISEGLVKGEEVVVSIRPEKIHIAERYLANQNMFHAQVTRTVYIGADTHIYVDVHGSKLKVLEQNHISRLDPNSFHTVGQEIWLMLMPENTLVLKKE